MREQRVEELQEAAMRCIEWYFAQKGRPPSVREIGEYIGIESKSHVYYHLKHLEEQGYIQWVYNGKDRKRSIRLTKKRMFF